MNELKTYNLAEFLEADFSRPTVVRYDPVHETFDFDAGNGLEHEGSYYWNEASDFRSRAGLIDSLQHLANKTWFTAEHVNQLMALLSGRKYR